LASFFFALLRLLLVQPQRKVFHLIVHKFFNLIMKSSNLFEVVWGGGWGMGVVATHFVRNHHGQEQEQPLQ